MGFHCFPTWRCVWLGFSAIILVLGFGVAFDFVGEANKVYALFALGMSVKSNQMKSYQMKMNSLSFTPAQIQIDSNLI